LEFIARFLLALNRCIEGVVRTEGSAPGRDSWASRHHFIIQEEVVKDIPKRNGSK
jgi:hypothetical protein